MKKYAHTAKTKTQPRLLEKKLDIGLPKWAVYTKVQQEYTNATFAIEGMRMAQLIKMTGLDLSVSKKEDESPGK